ncbi:MAG: hypothetical protein QXL01_00365 [Thermoplasmatales archaeon]
MGQGFNPKTQTGKFNSASVLPIPPGKYDDIQLERDPVSKDIVFARFYLEGALLLTLELTYDNDFDLVRVREV